jgi:hypothetical protein
VRPPVGLDEPDHDVGAATAPALPLAEHGVGLADTRGRAQVDTEMAGRLDLAGRVRVRVRRRGAAHAFAGTLGAGYPYLLGDLGGLPVHGSPAGAIHSGSAFDGTTGGTTWFGSPADLAATQVAAPAAL